MGPNNAAQIQRSVKSCWEREACGECYGLEQELIRYRLQPEILTFARFPDACNTHVLEIGVGMGADYLRWLRNGAHAVGIDLTERAVHITNERARAEGHSPKLSVCDAEHLAFPTNTFDLVYSWGVLHHTPDTHAALSEACRVLKPNGTLRIMLFNRHSWAALGVWPSYSY